MSFGYYDHQVTALTAVFLQVEEYAPLIFRVKGNIKAASSYKTGVENIILRQATCVVKEPEYLKH